MAGSGSVARVGSKSAHLDHGKHWLGVKVCSGLGLYFWVPGRCRADRLLLCLADGERGTAVQEQQLHIIHKSPSSTITRHALDCSFWASVKESTEGVVKIGSLTQQI